MNNGVKAEKENTPNEANLQEEEVRSGSVRWRVGPGTPAARRFSPKCGRRQAGRGSRGAAVQGLGIAPDCGPGRVYPRGGCFCVFVGACLKLRNFEDFSETWKHNAQLCLPEILKAESRTACWVTSDYWDPKGPNFCVWRCKLWGVFVRFQEELGGSLS